MQDVCNYITDAPDIVFPHNLHISTAPQSRNRTIESMLSNATVHCIFDMLGIHDRVRFVATCRRFWDLSGFKPPPDVALANDRVWEQFSPVFLPQNPVEWRGWNANIRFTKLRTNQYGLPFIHTLSTLHTLDLSGSFIMKDVDLEALVEVRDTLHTLILSWCLNITDTGMRIIPELLHLHTLVAVDNNFTDACTPYICLTKSLQHIDVSNTSFTTGKRCITSAGMHDMLTLPCIKSFLAAWSCGITVRVDDVANLTLTFLDVSNTSLTIESLSNYLTNFPALCTLNLQGCLFSPTSRFRSTAHYIHADLRTYTSTKTKTMMIPSDLTILLYDTIFEPFLSTPRLPAVSFVFDPLNNDSKFDDDFYYTNNDNLYRDIYI